MVVKNQVYSYMCVWRELHDQIFVVYNEISYAM